MKTNYKMMAVLIGLVIALAVLLDKPVLRGTRGLLERKIQGRQRRFRRHGTYARLNFLLEAISAP